MQEPTTQYDWHAKLSPPDHPLNQFEFDVLVGAEGVTKSRVPGFDIEERKGELTIGITANFKTDLSQEEVEISGISLGHSQERTFFKVSKEGYMLCYFITVTVSMPPGLEKGY